MAKLTPTAGLSYEDNSTPTSTALQSAAAMIDTVLYEVENSLPIANANLSIGIDFGSSQNIGSIKLYISTCMNLGTQQTVTGWDSGYDNYFDVYKSSDNSTWTFVERVVEPTISDIALGQAILTIPLSTPVSSRYIQIHLPGGAYFTYV